MRLPPPHHLYRANGVPPFTCKKLKTWCTHFLALYPNPSVSLICPYFMISHHNMRPSSLHGADIPFEEAASSKCYGLTRARLWVPATQSKGAVVRSSHSFSPDVSIIPYPRVSHQVTLMTYSSNNKINRQQTIRFSSISSIIIHILDGWSAFPRPRCSQGGGGIQCTPQPPADCDCDSSSNGHCGMCEYCTTGTCGDARE